MTADTTTSPSGADDDPHSTLTQTETPQLTTNGPRSPANRLGRRLITRKAISPIIKLLSARSPRA